jgi:hypothetical protein
MKLNLAYAVKREIQPPLLKNIEEELCKGRR